MISAKHISLKLMSSDNIKLPEKRIGSFGMDAYEPEQIAQRVLEIGVKKTKFPIYKTMILGILGGCFISLGALYEIYIHAHPDVNSGTAVIVAPLFYAVGYIIAFIAGAEVFTTNNLSSMALASGKVSLWEVSVNWTTVLFANLIGAAGIVLLFYYSGLVNLYDNSLVNVAKTLTSEKLEFGPLQTIIIGLFGNMLICAGLWIAMAGRTVTDKFLALLVPVAAVPALNFQHSTGNMFQFFLALVTETDNVDLELPSQVTAWAVTSNLALVSIGNIIGGGVFIAIIYYFVFIKDSELDEADE